MTEMSLLDFVGLLAIAFSIAWLLLRPLFVSYRVRDGKLEVAMFGRIVVGRLAREGIARAEVSTLGHLSRSTPSRDTLRMRVFLSRFLPPNVLVLETIEPRRIWVVSPEHPEQIVRALGLDGSALPAADP